MTHQEMLQTLTQILAQLEGESLPSHHAQSCAIAVIHELEGLIDAIKENSPVHGHGD